jgi:hypothetical protein
VRPPREAYVRSTLTVPVRGGDIEMIVGVEMRDVVEFTFLKNSSQTLMFGAWLDIDSGNMTEVRLAEAVEAAIKQRWPDRAYFIEVCAGGERDGWVQIFQPWEKP